MQNICIKQEGFKLIWIRTPIKSPIESAMMNYRSADSK